MRCHWKNLSLALILFGLAGCTANNPELAAPPSDEDTKPSFVKVHNFASRVPRKAVALPDGAFAVLFDKYSRNKDPLAPPLIRTEIMRLEKNGSLTPLCEEEIESSKFMDLVFDGNDLIVLSAYIQTALRFGITVLDAKSGKRLFANFFESPHQEKYDQTQGKVSAKGRFYWFTHGYDVGALALHNGVLHIASRNRAGSLFYTSYQKSLDHEWKELLAPRILQPGFTGFMALDYSGRIDVFSQRKSIYRPHLAVDENGNAYVGGIGPEEIYRQELEHLEKSAVAILGRAPAKDSVGLYLTKVSPEGNQNTFYLPFYSEAFRFAVLDMKEAHEKLWITGYERDVEGRNGFRGFVLSISHKEAAKNPGESVNRRYVSDASIPSMAASLLVDENAVYVVGAQDFQANPTGFSIGAPMNGFLQKRSLDNEEIATFVSRFRPSPMKPLLKKYTFVTANAGEVCSFGNYAPSTHAVDKDFNEFRTMGFVECISSIHQ